MNKLVAAQFLLVYNSAYIQYICNFLYRNFSILRMWLIQLVGTEMTSICYLKIHYDNPRMKPGKATVNIRSTIVYGTHQLQLKRDMRGTRKDHTPRVRHAYF